MTNNPVYSKAPARNLTVRKLGFALATLATTSMAFVAPQANAARVVYPGTVCQVWGGNKDMNNYVSYSQFGAIMNTHSSKKLYVVCPIPRMNSGKKMDLRVYFSDAYLGAGANSVGRLACQFKSNTQWGNSHYAAAVHRNTEAHPGTTYNGVNSGNWLVQNLQSTTSSSQNYGHTSIHTVFCGIPPKQAGRQSFIGSIVANDNN